MHPEGSSQGAKHSRARRHGAHLQRRVGRFGRDERAWRSHSHPLCSELEARRLGEMLQPRGHGIEQIAGAEVGGGGAGDDLRAHHGFVADDGRQPPARFEALQQVLRNLRDRAGEHDHIEFGAFGVVRAIGLLDGDVVHAGALQVGARHGHQFFMNFQGLHRSGAVAEQRGHEAAARADFEHPFILAHREFLQDARLYLGGEHVLAAGQGNFGVHEGQTAIGRGHEVFAAHAAQQFEDAGVQHIPGTDLLLDHVETGLLDAHGFSATQGESATV